jgi:altronate hydrolase
MNNNPSVGNKAGGLDDDPGEIARRRRQGRHKHAQRCSISVCRAGRLPSGLVYMDTPGYDPVSATGQAAGGAQIICFTTGRGSAFGCAGVPTIKLATNNALFERMGDDMDVNCGDLIDRRADARVISQRIFDAIIRLCLG